ncbi:hypothetical protein ABG067_004623 [Albugo candida]
MAPVGAMSLWRARMARRANQVKQMQKINARETSHSIAPHRLQSEASIPSGPRPASRSCQTTREETFRKLGVPFVTAPEKAKWKQHIGSEKRSMVSVRRGRGPSDPSVKAPRDRNGFKSEECHVDQHILSHEYESKALAIAY